MVEPAVDSDPVPPELHDREVVLEAGAYEGAWAKKVCEQREGCVVFAFEPATRAYAVAVERLSGYSGVTLRNVALGKQDGTAVLCDRNRDGANTWGHNPENEACEEVAVVDVVQVVRPLGEIALAHFNAEGDEIGILEALLDAGLIGQFRMILVQWHIYNPEMRARVGAIHHRLSETHVFEQRGPWGCWKRSARG